MTIKQIYFTGGVVDCDKHFILWRVKALSDSFVKVDKFIGKIRLFLQSLSFLDNLSNHFRCKYFLFDIVWYFEVGWIHFLAEDHILVERWHFVSHHRRNIFECEFIMLWDYASLLKESEQPVSNVKILFLARPEDIFHNSEKWCDI